MEMNVDAKLIKAEREQRAWSQEHLAAVSGISLRTVQRVESTGSASYDTARAIAAVFERDVAELRAPEIAVVKPLQHRPRYVAVAACVVAAVGILVARNASASQFLLDVGLSVDGASQSKNRIITEEGRGAEIRLEGQLKLLLVANENADGSVALAFQLYEFKDQDFVLVSKPAIFVADNKQGEIRVTSSRGTVYGIVITPHKIH